VIDHDGLSGVGLGDCRRSLDRRADCRNGETPQAITEQAGADYLRTACGVIEIQTFRMSLIRPIVIALLLAAWWPAMNTCVLAAAVPQIFSDCCSDSPTDVAGGCAENSCQKCVNLENGLAISLLHAVKLQAPAVRADAWLTKLQRLLSKRADTDVQLTAYCYTPPEQPLWHLVVRTALPVRGPSIG
jgi:hypothetical protein